MGGYRRPTLSIMQDTYKQSFQGRMNGLDLATKRAAIKQIAPLFYAFGYQLTPPKDYLKEYDEPHDPI